MPLEAIDSQKPSSVAPVRAEVANDRVPRRGLAAWLATWIHRRIAPSFERYEAQGESFAYLDELARETPGGFLRFLLFMPAAGHGVRATPEMLAVARLAATAVEDCGPCVQTSARIAREAGVDPLILRAVVEGRGDELPAPLARIERYARAVAGGADDANTLADALAHELGEDVRAELALAVATVRVFPTLKRGLGMARGCALHRFEV